MFSGSVSWLSGVVKVMVFVVSCFGDWYRKDDWDWLVFWLVVVSFCVPSLWFVLDFCLVIGGVPNFLLVLGFIILFWLDILRGWGWAACRVVLYRFCSCG